MRHWERLRFNHSQGMRVLHETFEWGIKMNNITKTNELLSNIRVRYDELSSLLEEVSGKWGYDDSIYRFYSQSFKVYRLQYTTRRIVEALRNIAPKGTTFNSFFEEIIQVGANGKEFDLKHNEQWTLHTRPIVEAFFHARYFLEAAVKHVKYMDTAPQTQPPGRMAAMFALYNLWDM